MRGSGLCPPVTETGATVGIVNPGGTDTKPGPADPGADGLGELEAKTLPILKHNRLKKTKNEQQAK